MHDRVSENGLHFLKVMLVYTYWRNLVHFYRGLWHESTTLSATCGELQTLGLNTLVRSGIFLKAALHVQSVGARSPLTPILHQKHLCIGNPTPSTETNE